MTISKAFKELLENNDRNRGQWLPKSENDRNYYPLKFIEIGPNRGRVVYIQPLQIIRNPIDKDKIKQEAIKQLSAELPEQISRKEVPAYIDVYEGIVDRLMIQEDAEHIVRRTFCRLWEALAHRHFDPETLEFDIEKWLPRDLASVELRQKLEEYRRNPNSSALHSLSTEEIEFSVRAYNLIKEQGIQTFGELLHVKDFLRRGKVRGVGRKMQKEIEEIITYVFERSE